MAQFKRVEPRKYIMVFAYSKKDSYSFANIFVDVWIEESFAGQFVLICNECGTVEVIQNELYLSRKLDFMRHIIEIMKGVIKGKSVEEAFQIIDTYGLLYKDYTI